MDGTRPYIEEEMEGEETGGCVQALYEQTVRQ